MPKDTFYNLSEVKKQRIFQAAVKEFATRRFSEASINQIIKTAEIPRGSFYQYFTGKEDIFLYMFQEILREKREVLSNADFNLEQDVFELTLQSTQFTMEWSKSKPEYSHISMLMELDNNDFITQLRNDSTKPLRALIERDKARGLIKAEVDTDLIIDMIYALILKEYTWNGIEENLYIEKIRGVIKVIKEGVAL